MLANVPTPCGPGGSIRPPFFYVSYEAIKRVSGWQRIYSVGLRRPPDAGPKHCQHSQISRAQSPLNLFHTWCNMLLTGLHQSPVVSIPLLLPSKYSYFTSLLSLPPLHARELGAIIIIKNHSNWCDLPISNLTEFPISNFTVIDARLNQQLYRITMIAL